MELTLLRFVHNAFYPHDQRMEMGFTRALEDNKRGWIQGLM